MRQADDLGRPVADVLAAHPDIVRVLTGAFDLHHLPNRVEMRLKPSGKVIGYTLALVRDDSGEVVGAAMFFKDLTRVEQLEERERLRDRLAAVGEMAAAIAHEVKNPLAGIEVMAGLLRRKMPRLARRAGGADRHHQRSEDGQRHRPGSARLRPADPAAGRAHVGRRRRAGGAFSSPTPRPDAAPIEVQVDVPDGLPHIQADEHQLTQLFTNLLINAYEAMGGQGHDRGHRAIAVRLEDGGDGREAVLVEVADDGPGMPADVAEKVFDPFFTTKAQGSGLGLAIVRKIVDAHDGRIDLQTAPGRGHDDSRHAAGDRSDD